MVLFAGILDKNFKYCLVAQSATTRLVAHSPGANRSPFDGKVKEKQTWDNTVSSVTHALE